jgi:rubrerythrin
MTDVEVLRIALGEEEKAIKIYQSMLAEHPNLKDMLLTLIMAEQNHKKVIEKKISDLTK